MSEVISIAIQEVPRVVSATAAGVFLFESQGLEIHTVGIFDHAISTYLSLPADIDPLLTRMREEKCALHERSLFSLHEWHTQPLYECVAGPFDVEHYSVAPLIGRGEIIGALTLARNKSEPAFTPDDVSALSISTAYVSVALAYSQRCEMSVTAAISQLTSREREIAMFVAKGLGNAEIARIVQVSENTIKKHLKNMFTKLGVSRRAEFAWLATLSGLV